MQASVLNPHPVPPSQTHLAKDVFDLHGYGSVALNKLLL